MTFIYIYIYTKIIERFNSVAAYSGMGSQNGKLFPSSDNVHSNMAPSPSSPTKKSPEKEKKKLEREKSSDSGGDAGENVLFALPDQPKPKPYMRHQSNVSVTSGDSGYHDNLMNAQKLSQTLGAGDASTTGTTGKIDIDIGMDIDKDTDTQEQTQSPEKEIQERTQSPDSALSDEQSSPRLGEPKPDRSAMKLDLPPSPLRIDRQLSKSPSEPALKLSQKTYSYISRSNAESPG